MVLKTKLENTVNMAAIPEIIFKSEIIIQFSNFICNLNDIITNLINQFDTNLRNCINDWYELIHNKNRKW